MPDSQPRAWRSVTPAIFAVAGLLMVTSASTSGGTDLRAGRYSDLADLAREQSSRLEQLRADVASLNADINRLSAQVRSPAANRVQQRIRALEKPAGLTRVAGPGLQIVMKDAPEAGRQRAGSQVSDAIVHQQDLQAVANSLWAGGAEAVTLQGQRIVSTTGIKCIGNTVLLQGVAYSPPYVFTAVGDPAALRRTLSASPYVQAYLQAVDRYGLGWDLRTQARVEAPAYDGALDMRYARPAVPSSA